MDAGVRSIVKFRTVSIALTLGIAACAALSLAAQKGGQPSGAVLFAQDKGKLTIKLGGQTVGHEEFEIAPSGGGWVAKGTAEIKPPEGSSSKVSGSLTMRPDGAPISYEWSAQTEKTNGAHILFANGVASITLQMQGARPFQQDLSFNTPFIAVLDNNGKTFEGLKVNTSDLEILLLLDSKHRLMRLEVPDAKVSVIRD